MKRMEHMLFVLLLARGKIKPISFRPSWCKTQCGVQGFGTFLYLFRNGTFTRYWFCYLFRNVTFSCFLFHLCFGMGRLILLVLLFVSEWHFYMLFVLQKSKKKKNKCINFKINNSNNN